MNPLHKAYQVLGLEPGTSFETVKRRYKRLVMVWHPDRMQNEAGRREAEEELKRINHAYDILKSHFENGHTATASCTCRPTATSGQHTDYQGASGSGTSSGNHGTNSKDKTSEEEARRRHEERCRKAEEEARRSAPEAARKADEQWHAAEASNRAAQDALKQAQALKEEKLRWKVAMAAGAALALLLGFAFLGVAARNLVGDIQRQWNNQSPQTESVPNPQPPPPVSSGNPPAADDPDNPYIPWQYRFPGGNPTSWRKFMDQEERKQHQREDEQRKQDIYFTRLAIDRNQKIIDHCTNTIAQLEAKIADPYVSEFEKNKLRDYSDFQQRNLENAQRELAVAQDKLDQLQR
jgi:curved DNA-binding protein CbpA